MTLNTLYLSENLKKKLRNPFGKLFSSFDELKIKSSNLVTVGDRVSYKALDSGFEPWILVYDGKEKRKVTSSKIKLKIENYHVKEIKVRNPPSTITRDVFQKIKNNIKINQKIKIFVNGEEDLVVLPMILKVPNNTIMLYGLRNEGVVAIKINKRVKEKCKKLLNYMSKGP